MPATRQGILSIIGRTKGNVAPLRCHRKQKRHLRGGESKIHAIPKEGTHKISQGD